MKILTDLPCVLPDSCKVILLVLHLDNLVVDVLILDNQIDVVFNHFLHVYVLWVKVELSVVHQFCLQGLLHYFLLDFLVELFLFLVESIE